jgi:hypothetical protein
VHHIEHWADGGRTCLSNLVLLCRHHHRLLHEGRYYIVKDGIHFMFFRPDGTEIDPGRETLLRAMYARHAPARQQALEGERCTISF